MTLNVSLTPHLEDFIRQTVSSGRYQSASEVVRAALRLLEHEEKEQEARLAALRAAIDEGITQADRGETIDADTVLERLRAEAERLTAGTTA